MFPITKANRKATPALIGLWGPSSSGKTMSALRMARGLVGPKGKIGLIDTENRRAEFYADEAGGWEHLDFQPPFTPERYTEAFKSYETAGQYGCIIVDSVSHVWEGEGGVLELAEKQTKRSGGAMTGLKKWQAPKMAYKRMLNNLLRAPFHVIFCLRAKEATRQTGKGDNAEIESVGLEPICEKNFIYEMTVSVLLGPNHFPLFNPIDRFKCSPSVPAVKAPKELWGSIRPGEFLSEKNGEAIAQWVSGGAVIDQKGEELKRIARDVATLGTKRLEEHWSKLTKEEKATLKPAMEEIKFIATETDANDTEELPVNEKQDDPLADSYT